MSRFASTADVEAINNEMPWQDRPVAETLHALMAQTAARHGSRNALSFQLESGPKDAAETLTWADLYARSCQAANMFRSLGIGEGDVVAFLLPNCTETATTLLGGAIAGIVNPINPLLEANQIAAILRETGAKVLVTLKAFPKSDVAHKAAQALLNAPEVETVLEVDLNRYLKPPKSWIVPFLRPKHAVHHRAKVLDFATEMRKQPPTLAFEDSAGDRVCAYFHTGGTTGMPKVAQHQYSGMVFNGWLGATLLFRHTDVLLCPLPLFHVFAAYPVLMSAIVSGAHVVLPTPQGYRGDGVFDNFWKLVERWGVTFMITVPTAISALMQRPVDADVSTMRMAISGSAPLPVELYQRFEKATGVQIAEGYGLTEATCLVSCNPVDGPKKTGSVGLPLPYCDVRILHCDAEGNIIRECPVDEVGEICVSTPGVFVGRTYSESDKNSDLFADGKWLRTGDLGRLDPDGYLWITGRAKDLIIRGGHNIDPAMIEDALMAHEAVAFAGAIGQPDAHSGELPCAYVELVNGGTATTDELLAFAKARVPERAAQPKYIEVLPELPKTAVGKVLKNDLRKLAIARVYGAALAEAKVGAEIGSVYEDKKRGLVARLVRTGEVSDEDVAPVLGVFTRPWEWDDAARPADD
ncbi:acyl-CoA synthetase [Frigidibacter sp. ROC022]|uniref:acyl-CoA synthetase n=1 Tax=Frigidibacter sp. ROC022 TaxID=2971796 RepID=UPI00215A6518|nr:acyl-CoA synthetase [Frigidibacter sp. ROC022]MCR8725403.1 acyl-CoA synthetase [Frigidibacter sp. ROC022]